MLRKHIPLRAKYIVRELSRLTVGNVADRVMAEVTRFVILTNGRTGSNLLVSYLQQDPNIRLYGEILGSYYLGQPFIRDIIRQRGAVHYLKTMQARCLTERYVGVKLLYAQLGVSYSKHQNLPDLPSVLDQLVADKSTKIIHLRRINLLDIIISGAMAKETNSYVGRVYGDLKITLTADECRKRFNSLHAQEARHCALFAHHPYLEITYEDLVDDPDGSMAAVFSFLGAEPRPARTTLRKQGRAPRTSALANYEELKREFAGSAYARFFT